MFLCQVAPTPLSPPFLPLGPHILNLQLNMTTDKAKTFCFGCVKVGVEGMGGVKLKGFFYDKWMTIAGVNSGASALARQRSSIAKEIW